MLTAVGRSYTAGVMPLGNVLPRCRHFSQQVFKGIYDQKIYSKNVNLTFKGPIVATAAQKKKSSSKKSKLPPLPTVRFVLQLYFASHMVCILFLDKKSIYNHPQ